MLGNAVWIATGRGALPKELLSLVGSGLAAGAKRILNEVMEPYAEPVDRPCIVRNAPWGMERAVRKGAARRSFISSQ